MWSQGNQAGRVRWDGVEDRKGGGWGNFGLVVITIGVITFIVSLFGFCGVHQESVCLLISYIVLTVITLALVLAVILILRKRDLEMDSVSQLVPSVKQTSLHMNPTHLHHWIGIFFLCCASFGFLLFLMNSLLLVMVIRLEDGFVTLVPV